jgi:hypothetical protein
MLALLSQIAGRTAHHQVLGTVRATKRQWHYMVHVIGAKLVAAVEAASLLSRELGKHILCRVCARRIFFSGAAVTIMSSHFFRVGLPPAPPRFRQLLPILDVMETLIFASLFAVRPEVVTLVLLQLLVVSFVVSPIPICDCVRVLHPILALLRQNLFSMRFAVSSVALIYCL